MTSAFADELLDYLRRRMPAGCWSVEEAIAHAAIVVRYEGPSGACAMALIGCDDIADSAESTSAKAEWASAHAIALVRRQLAQQSAISQRTRSTISEEGS